MKRIETFSPKIKLNLAHLKRLAKAYGGKSYWAIVCNGTSCHECPFKTIPKGNGKTCDKEAISQYRTAEEWDAWANEEIQMEVV